MQLLAENPDMNESDRALTSIMLNNTKRIDDTVNHVLELSRRLPPDFKTLNLDTWIPGYLEEFQEGRAISRLSIYNRKHRFQLPLMRNN